MILKVIGTPEDKKRFGFIQKMIRAIDGHFDGESHKCDYDLKIFFKDDDSLIIDDFVVFDFDYEVMITKRFMFPFDFITYIKIMRE